jgi:hypothetical protein
MSALKLVNTEPKIWHKKNYPFVWSNLQNKVRSNNFLPFNSNIFDNRIKYQFDLHLYNLGSLFLKHLSKDKILFRRSQQRYYLLKTSWDLS